VKHARALVSSTAALLATFAACSKSQSPTAPAPSPVAATPAPSPTPSPSPTVQGCSLPPMPDCSARGAGNCCSQGYDVLGEQVYLSIRRVQEDRPELFDRDFLRRSGDAELVVELIARELERTHGLCASPGNPIFDEVAVKRTNEFSEQFDVIIGDGTAVNLYGYQVTCRPARF
jgi:hypothetical protein